MSIFESAASVVFLFGAIAGIGVSGYKANEEIPKLKEQAEQIRQEAQTLEEKYNSLFKAEEKAQLDFETEVATSLNNISKLNAQIFESKQKFNIQYRRIQVIGVIFLVSLFLILIFKEVRKLFFKNKKLKR
jgi:predicted PurR-regulated permease PerM